MKTLPKQPSKLLRLALNDLEKAEQHEDYKVSMNAFHEPNEGKCIVCLAGCVMAFSLGADKTHLTYPRYFDGSESQLNALSAFAGGLQWMALDHLGVEQSNILRGVDFPPYSRSSTGFKQGITTMINDLEKAGL